MTEHSQLPWRTSELASGVIDDLGVGVVICNTANAAFIVKTVNNHAEMDKLLAEAADYLNSHPGMGGMDLGFKITEFRRRMLSDLIAGKRP